MNEIIMKNDLKIQKTGNYSLPYGQLWTFVNPFEESVFKHFSDGLISVYESHLPELVNVASLHGWTVTRV